MKIKKKVKFLVTAFVEGKCKSIFFASNLSMLPTLKMIYPGCHIEVSDLRSYERCKKQTVGLIMKRQLSAENSYWLKKRGKFPTKVICTTTGKIWDSVNECAAELHIPRMTIYQAINKKFAASKMRFEYYFGEQTEKYGEADDKPS